MTKHATKERLVSLLSENGVPFRCLPSSKHCHESQVVEIEYAGLRYTLKSLMVTTTAIAAWLAFVTYGTRVAGAAGGLVGGITMGLGIAFFLVALRKVRTGRYVASAILLIAFPATVFAGYLILDLHAIFASPDLTLTRNFQKLVVQLRHDKAFTNVEAKIQREAIGGCVVLTGNVDSNDDLARLESICLTYGHDAIWNRVRVSKNAK